MSFFKGAAVAAVLGIAATGAATEAAADPTVCDDGEIVVRFSHVTNTDRHPKGIAATLLSERINAEIDGTMCIEVFANSTLYNDDQVLDAMLRGDVQMAAPSLSKFEAYTRVFRIFDLPFMFANIDAVDAFQASATGQAMLDSMQTSGFQGLAFWHNGMKQMSANVPLVVPTDAAGLSFRVQNSDVLAAQMQAMGARPVPLAFSEVHGALASGEVDGQENTWSNIYGQSFHEVQDGITETNHGIIDYLVVTSTEFLNALDAPTRAQFLTILAEVTAVRNGEAFAVNEAARQDIINAGSPVRVLTPEQRQAWVDAMLPVWGQFVGDVGQDNIDAAQVINASFGG